jgi:hypothetical protein
MPPQYSSTTAGYAEIGVRVSTVSPLSMLSGAALIKFDRKLAYADAFGVELASASADHVLVTADFDLKAAARDVSIEFLPHK